MVIARYGWDEMMATKIQKRIAWFLLAPLLCCALLISCIGPSGVEEDEVVLQRTATISEGSQPTNNGETATVIVTRPPATLTPTIASEPTLIAKMPQCTTHNLILSVEDTTDIQDGVESGIYSICSDGSQLQLIYSRPKLIMHSLVIAPDYRTLAISAIRQEGEYPGTVTGTLLQLDMYTGEMHSILDTPEGDVRSFFPRWSADGRYLAYLVHPPLFSDTPLDTYVEILHVESGTTSSIHVDGLQIFDWAPDGVNAAFGTWVEPEGNPYGLDVYRVSVGKIICDESTYECTLSDLREISNVAREPSWTPDAQHIVSTTYGPPGSENKILITDLNGEVTDEIDLDALTPYVDGARWPRMSTDERYMAFLSWGNWLYIVDRNDMTLVELDIQSELPSFIVVDYDWVD
jgi:hypothetical protein